MSVVCFWAEQAWFRNTEIFIEAVTLHIAQVMGGGYWTISQHPLSSENVYSGQRRGTLPGMATVPVVGEGGAFFFFPPRTPFDNMRISPCQVFENQTVRGVQVQKRNAGAACSPWGADWRVARILQGFWSTRRNRPIGHPMLSSNRRPRQILCWLVMKTAQQID